MTTIWTLPQKNYVRPSPKNKKKRTEEKNNKIKVKKKLLICFDPSLSFFNVHGNGDTIRIGQEI